MEHMKVQCCVRSDDPPERLTYLKQMNIDNCYLMFTDAHSNYDDANRAIDRIRKAGITINDAGNDHIYKHPSIHLGLPDRDDWIEKYNALNRVIGNAGIPVGYMTWDTGRVSTTRWAAGAHSHGAVVRIVDMAEIGARAPAFDRVYEEEELWENFRYWWKAAEPVCREVGLRVALHPNDPPAPHYEGCASLIHSADSYHRAIAEVGNSPVLGIKFCVGCWLEGGMAFGNVLDDLKSFIDDDRVLIVHFRNVSATLPYFEETLLEDGYMDMFAVMRRLVESGYHGAIHVDHVPRFDAGIGGQSTAWAYSTGYMKGLLAAAEHLRAGEATGH